MVRSHPKGIRHRLSEHFSTIEFDCSCSECSYTFIDEELIDLLQKMRDILGCPITVTSGYRCEHKQTELQAAGFETAKKSSHKDGRAADLWTGKHSGEELEKVARDVGFMAVGVGETFAHVDTRKDKVRRWTYGVRER